MEYLNRNKTQLILITLIPIIFLYRMIFFGEVVTTNDELERYPINEWRDSYLSTNEDTPHWFPNLFSGMPSYGGYIYTNGDPTKSFRNKILFNPGLKIWFYLSLSGIGMFVLLRLIGISRNSALFGSLISALTPYSFGLINAGHLNKIFAMAYIPWVLAAALYCIRGITLKSILLLAVVTALQLWANHPQIVYYTWMVVGFYFIWVVCISLIEKNFYILKYFKTLLGIILGLLVALILVSDPYYEIYKFHKYSDRGLKSVLNDNEIKTFDKTWEYSTRWSFHPKEIVSLVFPYYYGLQNTQDLKKGAYWGHMPFTQSTHYLGLIALIFSILGVLLKRPEKQEMVFWVVTLLALVTGFGSFFPILYKPFFTLLPFFSKFRVPSMIYVLLAVTIPLLGAKGLDIVATNLENESILKKIIKILSIFLGLIILFIFFYDSFMDFSNANDSRYNPNIISELKKARINLFEKGLFLSFGLISGLVTIFISFLYKKIMKKQFIVLIIMLSIIDLWIINSEFMNIKPSKNFDLSFKKSKAISYITKDTGHFRILPADEISSNKYSYWNLESVSGYRPIKLRIYQDMMDAKGLKNPNILDMLNVKYVLTRKKINNSSFSSVENINGLYENNNVLPKSWIVGKVKSVKTQKESLMYTLLPSFDPLKEAIVVNYKGENFTNFVASEVSVIKKVENRVELFSNSETGGLLILSEVFYDPGWKAYVNGQLTPIYQTNHILRSVEVPSGDANIVFNYDINNWYSARLLSRASFLVLLFSLFFIFWKENNSSNK